MIVTVFVTDCSEPSQQRAELLESAWQQSGQSGELLRLVAGQPQDPLPLHLLARVEATLSWTRHPYIDDSYAGYDLPATLLQWLWAERADATLLLMDLDSIQCRAIEREVAPGESLALGWDSLPCGEGPFKLPDAYAALQAYCVNRDLELPQVQLPLLIHSRDLLKLVPRWLELTGIIRAQVRDASGPLPDAVKVAFAIAAAEYRLLPSVLDSDDTFLRVDSNANGDHSYHSTSERQQVAGQMLKFLRPMRRPGVRQARVLDQFYVECGRPPRTITLNSSAAAIWGLCDDKRTLLDITQELTAQFKLPMETMAADITQAAKILRLEGAIDLETVT